MRSFRYQTALLALAVAATLPGGCARAAESTEAGKAGPAPDCVYVGTPNDVVAKMLDLAKVSRNDKLCDPGCGDARMVVAAAKKYGCRATGYEIDDKLLAEGRRLAAKRKVQDLVKIENQDIFEADYSQYTVVAMYLLPDMIVRLRPRLEKMKPGSRIVAHDYAIRGAKPDEIVTMTSNEDNVEHTIYLYTLPLRSESAAKPGR